MKLHFKKALAVLISAVMIITSLLIPGAAFAKTADSNDNYAEGEVIVVLKNDVSSKYMKAASVKSLYGSSYKQKNAFSFGDSKTGVNAVVLESGTMTTKQMLKQLKKNSAVKYALPNYKLHATSITNDTYSNYQWALDNHGQNGGTTNFDTNADTLWDTASQSEKEQVVAIVDTGIDFDHPDLKDLVWNNPYGSKLVGKHGRDFTGTIKNGEPLDDNGHGSHCAGIIAAQANNAEGISGINTSNVKIMALKFLDADGGGYTEGALAAFEYLQRAVKLGTNVIACNNSWGGGGDAEEKMLFDSIFDELGALGVISFVAAGNDSIDIGYVDEEDEPYYDLPAACDSPYCVTVAASNENDELADFSNYSDKIVDIAAPGTDILSTVSYNCFNPTLYTAAQKAELCADMQDYNGTLSETDFGYPKKVDFTNESFTPGTDYEISQVDGFGLDGKAVRISFTDTFSKNSSMHVYAFEIPFTVADAEKEYSISLAYQCDKHLEAMVYDVPASQTASEVFEERFGEDIYLWGGEVGNYWDHVFTEVNVKPEDEDDETEYVQDTNRKLVIIAAAREGSTLTIDDLAISSQDANPDDFGKYDFYNGTSMATPYATGAAALIKNACPDASVLDVINSITNAGRYSDALVGKTKNAKVLSLDDIDRVPPMITNVAYNEDKNVEITGSFKNITKITVNGEEVEAISIEGNKIVLADNNYNTNKLTIVVENAVGSDEIQTFVSAKPMFDTVSVDEAPSVFGTFAIPAGESSYFIGPYGSIGVATGDFEDETSCSYMEIGAIDVSGIFNNEMYTVQSAVFYNGCIWASILDEISSEYSGQTLGYETALVKYDLEEMTTTKIAELPEESINGSSLAVYNGELYLVGGFDILDTFKPITSVYKFDEKSGEFVKQEASLPEGRTGAKFLQYKDKLVGAFGSTEDGSFPSILVFDGTSWKTSAVELDSDDAIIDLTLTDGTRLRPFTGNIGYDKDGILLNGAFVYGYGDTFTYNPENDTVTANERSSKNSLADPTLVGTTVPGGFIGFTEAPIFDDNGEISVGSLGTLARALGDAIDEYTTGDDSDFGEEDEESATAYVLKVNNDYPTVAMNDYNHSDITSIQGYHFLWGDKVPFTVAADPGYVVTSVKNNGKVIAKKSGKVYATVTEKENNITTTVKLVASPITSFKVKDVKGDKYTLSWNKAKVGEGYQVQQYVGGKWKTVKTIKKLATTTCTVSVKAGKSARYRVRAYGTYNSKTVYGAGKGKMLYTPKKQAVKSVKGAKGTFTVKYSKDNKATGYQLAYSTDKSFKNAKTVKVAKAATVSKKVSGLAAGKYYVKVRTYKTIDGKTVYGAYSAAKAVTVK